MKVGVLITLLVGYGIAVSGWIMQTARNTQLQTSVNELVAVDAKLKAANATLEVADAELKAVCHKVQHNVDLILGTKQ